MKELSNIELKNVVGGINITGSLITSIIKGVTTFLDLGRAVGSAIRRAISGNMCSF